jgi:hypothetical protein
LVKVTDPGSFLPARSITINFQDLGDQVNVGDAYAKWGLHFPSFGDASPKILVRVPTVGGLPYEALDRVVQYGDAAGNSQNAPMVINFRFPVQRVGFRLGNGDSFVTATITAFDPLGLNLGAVTEVVAPDDLFVGVVTGSPRGIGKIAIDYGAYQKAEEIDELILEFVTRPQFTTFVSQVADQAGFLQTTIVVSNLTNSTAQGEVRLFASDATALTIEFNGIAANSFPFSIPPYSSRTLTSGANSNPVKVGYGAILSNVPVEGTAIFRTFAAGGAVIHEAGVGSTIGRYLVIGSVQKEVDSGFNSGVAAVNTTGAQANAWIYLIDEAGTRVAANNAILDLCANCHVARFLDEVFPGFAGQNFKGTVLITTDQPTAVVILRTIFGMPISTLPVGSTQQ